MPGRTSRFSPLMRVCLDDVKHFEATFDDKAREMDTGARDLSERLHKDSSHGSG